jgi:hypothetical protein
MKAEKGADRQNEEFGVSAIKKAQGHYCSQL